MNTIVINNLKYSQGEFLFTDAPIFCKGSRNTRDLIKKKNIDSKYYVFAKYNSDTNSWSLTDGKSAKMDKVLFRHIYLKTISELGLNDQTTQSNQPNTNNEEIIKAPELLELDDNEKFRDDHNNIIEIETRGEKKHDNIYFKVKDVSIGFDMPNLYTTLINIASDYEINIHYKYFMCNVLCNLQNQTSKKVSVSKELFLTYEGILRVLFVSKNNKTRQFIKWATETLFTVQMGTAEQKTDLISNILGCPAKVVREVFNADANSLPCVYFFTLGYVKDLRQSMNIDPSFSDDSIVGKYGYTDNLTRRTSEHIKSFGKIINTNLKLKYYTYVDPQYLSKAETDIKHLFESLNVKFKYDTYDELVIAPTQYSNIVKEKYNHMGKKYSGHVSELITKIKELEELNIQQELKHKIELQQKELDLQKEQYENKLKGAQIDMMQYKILLLEQTK